DDDREDGVCLVAQADDGGGRRDPREQDDGTHPGHQAADHVDDENAPQYPDAAEPSGRLVAAGETDGPPFSRLGLEDPEEQEHDEEDHEGYRERAHSPRADRLEHRLARLDVPEMHRHAPAVE